MQLFTSIAYHTQATGGHSFSRAGRPIECHKGRRKEGAYHLQHDREALYPGGDSPDHGRSRRIARRRPPPAGARRAGPGQGYIGPPGPGHQAGGQGL